MLSLVKIASRFEGGLFHVVGSPAESTLRCVFEVRAKGTASAPRDAERRSLWAANSADNRTPVGRRWDELDELKQRSIEAAIS